MHIKITFKVVWIGKLFVRLEESLSVDSKQTLSEGLASLLDPRKLTSICFFSIIIFGICFIVSIKGKVNY